MEANKTPARYWEHYNDKIRCNLCPHNCCILDDSSGLCGVRKNIDNNLYTLNYGRISSIALDPIEKKPLKQFYPGTNILSVGTYGCNFKCGFCQNYSIAQEEPETIEATSKQIVSKAQQMPNCIGVAFTYNEPSIWYEFVYDTCVLSKDAGLKNVLVTNGYINRDPLIDLLPYVDAMNIDVKAFSDKFYKEICHGSLEDVKRTVEISAKSSHVEITTLIIPEVNDDVEEITELAKWLAGIGEDIPLHLSRYFPHNKFKINPTPKETLYELKNAANKYLKYVYLGNI